MSGIERVQAAAEAWRQAMHDLNEASLRRLADDDAGLEAIQAAADVCLGSMDAADAAMTLAFLDAVAVVGSTVDG